MINRDILFDEWLADDAAYIAQADTHSILRRAFEAGYELKTREAASGGTWSSYQSEE